MTRVPLGRRAFLALSAPFLIAARMARGQSGKGSSSTYPPQRFLDAATEFDLTRLTDPQYNSWLPAPHLRFISRRGNFLVYTSERPGSAQVHRLDWRTGETRQLTAAAALDRAAVALAGDDRSVFYCDGPAMKQVGIGNGREREVASAASGWERAPGWSLSADAKTALWVERQANRWRLKAFSSAGATVLGENAEPITGPQLRPGHAQVSYRKGGLVRLAGLDGQSDEAMKLDASASVGQALWSPGGRTLLYLSVPEERNKSISLREYTPEDKTDNLVAKTSQFASFGINGDSSVFVGASRSLASPYVLLLLRVARRELTLCEHRSTDAVAVEPVFSPDSQNVFFTSDRKGKRAIYRAHVEKFVEETPDE